MADYLLTILDSRTLTNFSFSIPRSSPQNPTTQLPALSFDNPRTARKRRKKALHISLLSDSKQQPTLAVPSSSDLDIVSSHEHTDGSLIFRFGDPSEVVKDDALKESNASVEEEGSEGKEEFKVVKVLDGKYEKEVIVKRIEREEGSQVTNEEVDVANSVVATGSGSSGVTHEASEASEKLLEDPKHVQLLVSASSAELEKIDREEGSQESNKMADVAESVVTIVSGRSVVTDGVNRSREKLFDDPKHVQLPVSASVAEVENIEREKGIQGSNEAVDVPNSVVTIGSENSRITDEGSESSEELLEEPKDIKLPFSTSSSEVKKIEREEGSQGSNEDVDVANSMAIASETSKVAEGDNESSEKLLGDAKEVQLPVSVSRAEVGDSSSSVLYVENSRHDEEIPSNAFVLEKSNELENGSTYGEVLDKKRDDEKVLPSVTVKSDSDTEKEDNNRDQENTLENFEVLQSSIPAKDQGVETVHQNVPEGSVSHVMPRSLLREVEPIPDEEAENNTNQGFGGEKTSDKLPTINNHLRNRTLEAERSSNYLQSSDLPEVSDHELTESKSTDPETETSTNKFPISDLSEVSDHELIELKSTEVSLTSTQVQASELVLSSSAASLPHPSKVERMHALLLPRIG